jgi:hypothetical protein
MVLNDLSLDAKSNIRNLPALSTKILQRFDNSPDHLDDWHYRSVIGKLNYLEKSTRPDLAYAVHQCARFSERPKEEHSKAIKLIGRYLLGTCDKGLIFKPNNNSFECYCDADFSGNWNVLPGTEVHEQDWGARLKTGFPRLWIILSMNA